MCWQQRVRWEEEPRDLRVSQADRDEVIEQLRTHTADGRLDLDEFGERVEEALASKSRADLDRVLRQLPRLDRPRRRGLSPAGRVLAVVALVALAATVVGGWVFFLLFWLIPVTGGGHHRRERELVHL